MKALYFTLNTRSPLMRALYSTLNTKSQAVNDKLLQKLNDIIQQDIICIKSDSKADLEKLNIVPIKFYPNAELCKSSIYKENKNKTGIYRWTNLINNKSYIGSSLNLSKRFESYYSQSAMNKKLSKSTSIIYLSLLKNKACNFSLEVLEYCDIDELNIREQYYLDNLSPEYNIMKFARSNKGHKLSSETRKKISNALIGRVASESSKEKMRIAARARSSTNTSFFGKHHTDEAKANMSLKNSVNVKITDLQTKQIFLMIGNAEAAKFLKIGESTLRRYKQHNWLYLDRYLIENA